jgi:small conductance mechanosensitive channel
VTGSWIDRISEWAIANAPGAVRIALTPIAAYVLLRLAGRLIARLERLAEDDDPSHTSDREKRAQTLGRTLRSTVNVLIWAIAAMLVLRDLGVDLAPILAGAGIIGLAMGFGAQTLVKDVISGFFLLLEDQYRVNDEVSIAGARGAVEHIGLRTTVLRDAEGRVHIVPNGAVSVVTNHTRGWARALLDVNVAYKEDTDRCFQVLRRVGSEIEADPEFGPMLDGEFEYIGIEALADSAVVLRTGVRTRPEDRVAVLRELRRRVKQAFDVEGIEIPFPHTTITFGDGSLMPRRSQGPPGAPPGARGRETSGPGRAGSD